MRSAFDEAVRVVARRGPAVLTGDDAQTPVASVLNRARLFIVPHECPQKLIDDYLTDEEIQRQQEAFFLPYSTTAMQWDDEPNRCCVFWNSVPEQVGMHDLTHALYLEAASHKRVIAVSFSLRFSHTHSYTNYSKRFSVIGNKGQEWIDPLSSPDDFRRESKRLREYMGPLLGRIMMFNNPKFFVVEDTPPTYKAEVARRKRRPRLGARPWPSGVRKTYTFLTPAKIRERMRLPGMLKGLAPSSHERRRHLRRLRSPKFTHKQGQVVIVKACWVGPSEAVVDNHRYRVLLDV